MDSSDDSTHSRESADIDIQRTSKSSEEQSEDLAEIVPAGSDSIEMHRSMLLAGLLEERYRNRALDLLNATQPGRNYTRESPEVEALARQFFAQAGRVLSRNGLLSSTEISDDSRGTRSGYVVGLDSLLPMPRAPDILESMSQVLAQTNQLSLTAHPASDLRLTLPPPPRSHYRSTFREDCLLGRGGFGKVYQCYHHLDQKTYAVKKIILPSKLVKGLSDGNHDNLQHILREAKAMAMLDHPNIVRYHATWYEEPQRPSGLLDEFDSILSPPRRRSQQLLLDSHAFEDGSERGSSFSGAIVFGEDTATHQSAVTNDNDPNLVSRVSSNDGGIVFGEDTPTHQSAVTNDNDPNLVSRESSKDDGIVFGEDTPTHQSAVTNDNGPNLVNPERSEDDNATLSYMDTSSALESDIFTGGSTDRGNMPSCQSALDTAHALYIQMSMYPMTLAQFLSPPSSSCPRLRHCFHLAPTLRLALSIHDGLQYIHSKGLIHRDIKPGNIFLSSPLEAFDSGYCDFSCKLCREADKESQPTSRWLNPRIGDFGLVHQLTEGELSASSQSCGDGKNDAGTAHYQPPRKGEKKDEKIDIFALGVVLVEMLCRCNTAMERANMLNDLQSGEVPPDLRRNIQDEGHDSETAEKVVILVSSMIDEDPDKRWSGSKVREALQDLLSKCKG